MWWRWMRMAMRMRGLSDAATRVSIYRAATPRQRVAIFFGFGPLGSRRGRQRRLLAGFAVLAVAAIVVVDALIGGVLTFVVAVLAVFGLSILLEFGRDRRDRRARRPPPRR